MRPYDLLRGTRAIVYTIVITLAACVSGLAASADTLTLGADGWHTWTVPASRPAPAWCCFSWRSGKATQAGCNLDDGVTSFGSSDSDVNDTGVMQIYVQTRNDRVQSIHALSPQCPVRSSTEIDDLGHISTATSIEWLQGHVGTDDDLTDQSLAAISAHESAYSAAALVAMIENRKLPREERKQAMFWLVQTGSDEALAYFDEIFSES